MATIIGPKHLVICRSADLHSGQAGGLGDAIDRPGRGRRRSMPKVPKVFHADALRPEMIRLPGPCWQRQRWTGNSGWNS